MIDIVIKATKRFCQVKINVSRVNRAYANTSRANINLELANKGVKIFTLKKLKLLKQEDFLELLTDLLKPLAICLLVIL